jgi:membrane protease subunit (stomatin/prohibitin family)
MGIFDRLSPTAQFIEVIEWLDDSSNTLLYRFPVKDQEIKNGAQLIVRESQAAVFVHEGQIADQFPPGRYTIDGGNTPILSKLGAWKYGFNSPFKAEVYFVNTKQFTDLKWGTPNPIMMRDSDFGMVRLRAFGIYSMRVSDPQALIKEIAGTNAHFITEDIEGQLKRTLVGGFSDALGESKIAALDLASNYDELAKFTRVKLNEDCHRKYFAATRSRSRDGQAHIDGGDRRRWSLCSISGGRRNARRGAESRRRCRHGRWSRCWIRLGQCDGRRDE